jgi:hypothetical protein
MSDPVRDALVTMVEAFRLAEPFDLYGLNYRERQAFESGRLVGAQAVLTAYDAAKFQLGDTTEAATTKIRKRKK